MKASKNNLFTDQASGSSGNMTLRKRKSGKVVISKKRGPNGFPSSKDQLKVQKKFKRGVAYSNKVKTNPEKLALYTAAASDDQSAHILAVRDKLKAPVVDTIDLTEYTGKIGEVITIEASDDFMVASVTVEILNGAGLLVEKGNAVMDEDGIDWLYTTTAVNDQLQGSRITARALDLPKNKGSLEVIIS